MKKQFVQILVLITFSLVSNFKIYAQAPLEKAQALLAEEFDNPSDFDWEEDEGGEFIAYSFGDEGSIEVNYDDEGNWLQTSKNIDYMNLPDHIKSAVKKLYPDTPDYYDLVTHLKSRQSEKFMVSFETETDMVTLTFDKNGKLIENNKEPLDGDRE